LSESLKRKVEKISRLLERLATESAKGTPIVVEGQNDVDALRELDVKGEVIAVKNSGMVFPDVVSQVESRGKREVILLMDFDRYGKEWTKRLAESLERSRIKPNLVFWNNLLGLVGRDVKDVEGLASYVETLRRKCGG